MSVLQQAKNKSELFPLYNQIKVSAVNLLLHSATGEQKALKRSYVYPDFKVLVEYLYESQASVRYFSGKRSKHEGGNYVPRV